MRLDCSLNELGAGYCLFGSIYLTFCLTERDTTLLPDRCSGLSFTNMSHSHYDHFSFASFVSFSFLMPSVLLASGVQEEAGAISDQAVKDVENQESNSLDDSVKDEKDKDEAAAVKGTADSGDAGRNQTSVKSDDLPACPWFTCDNGRCLIDTWRCDQQDDCGDNSDEIGCENMICQPEMFRCASGMCITRSWLCDSFKDCPAGDDENNC